MGQSISRPGESRSWRLDVGPGHQPQPATDRKSSSGGVSRRHMVAAAAVGVGALWAVDASALARRLLKVAAKRVPATTAMPSGVAVVNADAHWASNIGSQFYLDGPAGTVMMTLLAVTPLPSAGVRPKDVPRKSAFQLRFDTGRVSAPPLEKTYTVYGRSVGRTQVFLSPSGLSPTVMTAVFN